MVMSKLIRRASAMLAIVVASTSCAHAASLEKINLAAG